MDFAFGFKDFDLGLEKYIMIYMVSMVFRTMYMLELCTLFFTVIWDLLCGNEMMHSLSKSGMEVKNS